MFYKQLLTLSRAATQKFAHRYLLLKDGCLVFSIYHDLVSVREFGFLLIAFFFFLRKGFQNILVLVSLLAIVVSYVVNQVYFEYLSLLIFVASVKWSNKSKIVRYSSWMLLGLLTVTFFMSIKYFYTTGTNWQVKSVLEFFFIIS